MAYSLLDVIQGNPFDAAQNAAIGQQGNFPPAPVAAPQQQVAQGNFPPAPTPQASNPVLDQANQAVAKYNPMFDPEGPLAHSGPIGALLFGNGESRQDYILARQQQYQQMVQQQLGNLRYNAFQQLQQNVQQGMTPQKAFLSFLSTPAGADFIHKDPNPGEAIQQFMQLGTVNPMIQARMNAFGNGQQAAPPAMGQDATQQPQQPSTGASTSAAPAATVGTPPANPTSQNAANPQQLAQSPMLDPEYYLSKSKELMASGDVDGAKEALNMANTAQQIRAYMHPSLDTPDIKNYTTYAGQELAKGNEPMDFRTFSLEQKRAGAMAGETTESADLGHMRAGVIKTYADLGPHARDTLATLGQMNDALNASGGNISTGPGADLFLQAKQALGNVLGENLAGTQNAEVFKKMGAYLASSASKELTSRPTQFDFKTFIANNPGLEVSIPGNKMLIDLMAQKAQHDLDVSNLALSYKGQGVDWPKTVEEYDKTHPYVSPFTGKPIQPNEIVPQIQNEMAGKNGNTTNPSAPDNTPKFTEGQTATNPKTGVKMIFKNGAWTSYGQ